MNNIEIYSPLVDYSSDEEQCDENDSEVESSNETFEQNTTLTEKKTNLRAECVLLPVPSEIKCMFAEKSEGTIVDNPEKHGGKMRSFPHERGVWATYAYIEYRTEPEFLEMIECLRKVSEKHGIVISCVEDYHVSLSRTLKLRHHWIESFMDGLRTHLRQFIKFKIMFQSLEVYENEGKTRTFLGLKVHLGYDYLCKIIKKVDACLTEFKLPLFYKNPSFHLSCASCVGSKSEKIELFMADLNAVFHTFVESHPASKVLSVTEICCKIGNKLFKIPLKS